MVSFTAGEEPLHSMYRRLAVPQSKNKEPLLAVPQSKNKEPLLAVPQSNNKEPLLAVPQSKNTEPLLAVPQSKNKEPLLAVPQSKNKEPLLAVPQSNNKISCLCRDSNSGSSGLCVLLHRKSCCYDRPTADLTFEVPTRWRCDRERLLMT